LFNFLFSFLQPILEAIRVLFFIFLLQTNSATFWEADKEIQMSMYQGIIDELYTNECMFLLYLFLFEFFCLCLVCAIVFLSVGDDLLEFFQMQLL